MKLLFGFGEFGVEKLFKVFEFVRSVAIELEPGFVGAELLVEGDLLDEVDKQEFEGVLGILWFFNEE
jgi:hypothetical protein